MAVSGTFSQAKLRLLERFFPNASAAAVETFEILMDVDQMSSMLTSFEEVRKGHIVAFEDAFGDL